MYGFGGHLEGNNQEFQSSIYILEKKISNTITNNLNSRIRRITFDPDFGLCQEFDLDFKRGGM